MRPPLYLGSSSSLTTLSLSTHFPLNYVTLSESIHQFSITLGQLQLPHLLDRWSLLELLRVPGTVLHNGSVLVFFVTLGLGELLENLERIRLSRGVIPALLTIQRPKSPRITTRL